MTQMAGRSLISHVMLFPSMNPVQETELTKKASQGDRAALGELLEAYRDRLYNVCLRMVSQREDAAELTQDAMLKIIGHFEDFRGDSKLSTWMIRIAMNLSVSHLRKRKLRYTESLEAVDDDQTTALRRQLADNREPGPGQNVQQKEMLTHLQDALGRVDPDFRAVLILRDIEQMDYEQIGKTLSLPTGTVKSRLFRGRLALRRAMQQNYPQTMRQE